MDLSEVRQKYFDSGYNVPNANARTCQDVLLDIISRSPMNQNITIKGGVLMCSITRDKRRATQDLDLDFLSYSISDTSIRNFIETLSSVDEKINIEISGEIEELSQQDYKGKRVNLYISDDELSLLTKLDLGVHTRFDFEQEDRCFDIALNDEGVCLLANSKEQIFAEKLKSFITHGIRSTRHRDLHDMYYLGHLDSFNVQLFKGYVNELIIKDEDVRGEDAFEIAELISKTFKNKDFMHKFEKSNRNWSDAEVQEIADWLPLFIRNLK